MPLNEVGLAPVRVVEERDVNLRRAGDDRRWEMFRDRAEDRPAADDQEIGVVHDRGHRPQHVFELRA